MLVLLLWLVVVTGRCKQGINGSTVGQLSLLFGWDAPATFLEKTYGINASLAFMRLCGRQQVSDLSAFSCKLCSNDPSLLLLVGLAPSLVNSMLSLGWRSQQVLSVPALPRPHWRMCAAQGVWVGMQQQQSLTQSPHLPLSRLLS